jgi:hypothetical protein
VSRIRILLSYEIELNRVLTSSFIEGTDDRLLSGLNNLNVLSMDMLDIKGKFCISPVTTTEKSSQFQGSLRYEWFPKIKPMLMILTKASKVNADVKMISV